MGQVLSCETGLIPRCRSRSVEEKATSSHGEWLAWEEPRAVGDLVHVEKFFARNLGGLIHTRTRVPGRLGKATSRTPSMYVDEKSDEAIVLLSQKVTASSRNESGMWRDSDQRRGLRMARQGLKGSESRFAAYVE